MSKVKDYSALKKVASAAWEVIVASTMTATEEVATATFTERLLRPILKLEPDQQLELAKKLSGTLGIAELARKTEAVAEHGGDRKSDQGNNSENVTLIRGNSASYRIAKLKRDFPEIAQQIPRHDRG